MRRTGWIWLMSVAFVAVACSGDTPATPDGFTLLERDEYTLAYPDEWDVTADQPTRVGVTGPESFENVFETIIATVDYEAYGDFDAAVLAMTEPFRLFTVEGYEEMDNRSADIPGAAHATIIDSQYDSEITGGKIRQRMIFAVADTTDPLLFIEIAAPAEVFDEDVAEQITSTVSVRAP